MLAIVARIKKDINFIIVSNFNNGLQQYKNNNVDFVVVDYSDNECAELLANILEIKPKQKTITLSEDISCSEELGCDFCVSNYNRKRLLKPFNPIDLIMLLDKFDKEQCKYFKSIEHIETIIDDIIKRYIGCKYDNNSKTISFSSEGNHSLTYLFDIMSIFKKNNVEYEIVDERSIQIK